MKQQTLFFIILIVTSTSIFKLYNNTNHNYSLKTFKVNNGWGYSIYKKEKLIIKQEIIPSIQSKRSFTTEKEAVVIAKLMIEKLKNNKIPSISYKELQLNGINL
ncbi:DUF4907 domain-containing protein [Lutibacter sp. B1]|uniref:DUF4907 domain-containing protein n=1 Tax=Lutibacter sp. B1 TaxID=2725996 RepID=UPI00145685D2|nr:DUF4907 domain-containing protein [Lutibacter sp. B1]NLP58541.1 DUF4907 domain-containing protein [Lutibacter sp. B1]